MFEYLIISLLLFGVGAGFLFAANHIQSFVIAWSKKYPQWLAFITFPKFISSALYPIYLKVMGAVFVSISVVIVVKVFFVKI